MKKLTHHHHSSRSFILLLMVVLCAVFAALVLTRIHKLYILNPDLHFQQSEAPAVHAGDNGKEQITGITEWDNYQDPDYPLNIQIPKGWSISPNTEFEMERHLELKLPSGRTVIRIFITTDEYVAVDPLDGEIIETSTGDDVLSFDGIIFATRVGNYRYTYDGTADASVKEVLAHIVDTAKYDNLEAVSDANNDAPETNQDEE